MWWKIKLNGGLKKMSKKMGFGIFFLFISFIFFLGAIPLFVMANGYLYGPMISISSDESYAIVLNEDVELIDQTELPWELNELMKVKIRVYPESEKNLKIGIVPTGIARAFYENATYINVYSPFERRYNIVYGSDQLGDPSGFDTTRLTAYYNEFRWSPKEGKYSLLIFNNDLSQGIHASFQVGAKYYFFKGISLVLGMIGGLFFLFSFLLIVQHFRGSKVQPIVSPSTKPQPKSKPKLKPQPKPKPEPEPQPVTSSPPSSPSKPVTSSPPSSPSKPVTSSPLTSRTKERQLPHFHRAQHWTGNQLIFAGLVVIGFTVIFFIETVSLLSLGLFLPIAASLIVRGDQRNWDLRKRQEKILGSISTSPKEDRQQWEIYLNEIRARFYGDSEYYSSLDPGFDRIKWFLWGGGLTFFGVCTVLDSYSGPGFVFIAIGISIFGYALFRQNELKKESIVIKKAIDTTKNPTLAEISHILGKPQEYVRKRIEHMGSIGEINIKFDPKTGSVYHLSNGISPLNSKSGPSVPNEREYCEYCGRVLPGSPDENKFCPSCGVKLH